MPPVDSGPAIPTARTELADLIAESAGGLSDGERAVLELTYQHGLEGTDLAAALEVSVARARAMALRLRQTVDRSLGALLVARRIQCDPGACPELAEILDGWDGQFTSLTRKRITRHIDSCLTCELDRRLLVTPAALLCAAPAFIPAPEWVREETLRRVRLLWRAPTALPQRIAATVGWPPPRYSSPPWPPTLAPAGDAVEPGTGGDGTGETAPEKSVMKRQLRSS